MFFDYVWDKADGIFFLKGRPRFYHVDGTECRTNMPSAPSVLIAYGKDNARMLKNCTLAGKYLEIIHD